jgi:hypothetical protein
MKRIILLQIAWMVCLSAFAQQPFSKYGYKVKVATLSKGKYVEHFDQDTIVQIGTVMFNRRSGKIESFVEYDTTLSEYSLQPDLVSRWMSQDPLAEEFYDQSPYNFTDDNPINFVDPDGMAAISSFEFNVIADCPDCPNTPEYQPYINDPNMWYYDPQSGLVSNLPAVDVNGGGSSSQASTMTLPITYLPFEFAAPTIAATSTMTGLLVLLSSSELGKSEVEWLAQSRAKQEEEFKKKTREKEQRNPAQDKPLSKGEIEKLKRNGWDHSDKGKRGGKTDLYKDKDGNIYQKPKGGAGEGEPIGININDLD